MNASALDHLVEKKIDQIHQLQENIEKIIHGKRDVVQKLITALLAGGHVLIEDIPGLGKTTITKALAQSISCSFKRIQFTPDLIPSDIVGFNLYDETQKERRFQKGPIFANVVLADEINRTTPRIQSALLEAMNEGQVTVDGDTHRLAKPFMVIATQNPYGSAGTYALPDSQLDRFLLTLKMGYPDDDDELKILKERRQSDPFEQLKSVLNLEDMKDLQILSGNIHMNESVIQYVQAIAAKTRKHEKIIQGASPRAALHLLHASQAYALVKGRSYVIADDVKSVCVNVLAHRIILQDPLSPQRSLDLKSQTILEVLEQTAVPL